MCELLNAEPVWVINSGISFHEEVPTSKIQPWVQASQADNLFEYIYETMQIYGFFQDALDSIEFANGPTSRSRLDCQS